MKDDNFEKLNNDIVQCRLCPRLVEFRENVIIKSNDPSPWRKPVPGFGDPSAWLVITGLAPAAQGGNRTGRVFTGDLTSQFLMKALHQTGFANHDYSLSADDGLLLKGCYLTAAVKCVPPDNKPLLQEIQTCSQYYHREMSLLKNTKAVLALGHLGFNTYLSYINKKRLPFSHGVHYRFEGCPDLYGSYHPSPRNTQTKLLSFEMFVSLLEKINQDHNPLNKCRF